jgi:hypothetical protein
MRTRVIAVLWILLGAAVWNGFFDLYVSRASREYLQLAAEQAISHQGEPSMSIVMARARRAGAEAATTWAVVVIGAGWLTLAAGRKRDA